MAEIADSPLSISERQLSKAICDQDAFYPFRDLVQGGVGKATDLADAERFMRAVVLHDSLQMVPEPLSDPGSLDEWTPEEIAAGGRNVIVGFAPVLDSYSDIIAFGRGPSNRPNVSLSPRLLEIAAQTACASDGPYFDAHVEYFQHLVVTARQAGSILCNGTVGTLYQHAAGEYPEAFFSELDRAWQDYARAADQGDIGFVVPPVLSIVLTRANTREQIVATLSSLRDEWSGARRKVWQLIGELRRAATLEEANAIRTGMRDASLLVAPTVNMPWSSPTRVLWNIGAEVVAGATAAGLAGGDPMIGAVMGGVREGGKIAKESRDFGRLLFGRGAFDLARRVRSEAAAAAPGPEVLRRFLRDDELRAIGLG